MTDFLSLNGLRIPCFKDSFQETVLDHGDDLIPGAVGVMMSTRVAKLRRWKFHTGLLRNDEWKAYEAWIEGWGANWEFTSASKISGQGYTNTVAGTVTLNAGLGVSGGSVEAGSASFFAAQMRYRMGVQRAGGWSPSADGYTMFFHRKFIAGEVVGAGYHHCLITGATDYTQGAAAVIAGTAGYIDAVAVSSAAFKGMSSVSLTSPFCGVHGYKTDGVTASVMLYDSLVFLPFQIPSITTTTGLTRQQWVDAIFAQHASGEWSKLPRLKMGGECLEGETGVQVVGRVRTLRQAFGRKPGMSAADQNLRDLDVELYETLDA